MGVPPVRLVRPQLFSPTAAWASLTEEQRRQLGTAAIAQHVTLLLEREEFARSPFDSPEALEAAALASDSLLATLLADAVRAQSRQGLRRPDLSELGVQSCRVCGCTAASPCREDATWIEPDLCSACAE